MTCERNFPDSFVSEGTQKTKFRQDMECMFALRYNQELLEAQKICRFLIQTQVFQSDKSFDRITHKFLKLIIRGGLRVILHLNMSNVCVTGEIFGWRNTANFGIWTESSKVSSAE